MLKHLEEAPAHGSDKSTVDAKLMHKALDGTLMSDTSEFQLNKLTVKDMYAARYPRRLVVPLP